MGFNKKFQKLIKESGFVVSRNPDFQREKEVKDFLRKLKKYEKRAKEFGNITSDFIWNFE